MAKQEGRDFHAAARHGTGGGREQGPSCPRGKNGRSPHERTVYPHHRPGEFYPPALRSDNRIVAICDGFSPRIPSIPAPVPARASDPDIAEVAYRPSGIGLHSNIASTLSRRLKSYERGSVIARVIGIKITRPGFERPEPKIRNLEGWRNTKDLPIRDDDVRLPVLVTESSDLDAMGARVEFESRRGKCAAAEKTRKPIDGNARIVGKILDHQSALGQGRGRGRRRHDYRGTV